MGFLTSRLIRITSYHKIIIILKSKEVMRSLNYVGKCCFGSKTHSSSCFPENSARARFLLRWGPYSPHQCVGPQTLSYSVVERLSDKAIRVLRNMS